MIEKKLDRAITDFIWNVVEIHSQLEDIHTSWAGLLGITEPQWLILMAITELDQGRGVAGIDIANKLRVHPAFVTNQSRKGRLPVATAGRRRRTLRPDVADGESNDGD
jgi:MarR family transcriptional regulator, organic hydroperoxide resistance regulator